MTKFDDRQDFLEKRRRNSLLIGKDPELLQSSLDVIIKSGAYDYSYLWTWLGVPIIQMPADMIATQEVIWETKPDIIIETGVARGGSLIFMASILAMLGDGKVIGVDVDIRSHNRKSIEEHSLSGRVHLIEGDSTSEETIKEVIKLIPKNAKVMVVLDSDHSMDHVLAECLCYGELVSAGQYLVVADTVLGLMDEASAPNNRSRFLYRGNEPLSAVQKYLTLTNKFELDEAVNSKLILSSSPGGYLRALPNR